jgi:hypothetical protein
MKDDLERRGRELRWPVLRYTLIVILAALRKTMQDLRTSAHRNQNGNLDLQYM